MNASTRRRAVAQYRVGAQSWSLFPSKLSADENEYFRASQIAYVKSPFVINAALSQTGVASVPLLEHQSDPVEWLIDRLTVRYPEEGQVLEIELADATAPLSELRKIVEAVSRAYYEEVVFREQARRNEPLRLLKHRLAQVTRSRRTKDLELASIAADGDGKHPAVSQLLLRDEIRVLRRERLRTERRIAALGGERLRDAPITDNQGTDIETPSVEPVAKRSPTDPWATRLEELDRRIAALIEELNLAREPSQELVELRRERDRLSANEDRLARRIDDLELALLAPPSVAPIGGRGSGHAMATTYGDSRSE
ncbi:MAG: hypothetical protein AAF805_03905 [Planctomycetota bacterium]